VWKLLFCSRIMQAFIMTNDMRQMQHDGCMLIILYNFAHRPFIGFLSEPCAAKRKTWVEWTLDQAWHYSVVIRYTIKTVGFILIWTKPLYKCCCGGPRRFCPSYSLPAHAEQHVPLLPRVRAPHPRPLWLLAANSSSGAGSRAAGKRA